MKNIIKGILIAFVIVLFGTGCSKKWLEPEPLSFLSPENTFVNKIGFESAVITMRKHLISQSHGAFNHLVMDFACSDLGVSWSTLDYRKLTPSSDLYRFLDEFIEIYRFIKDANVVISRIDNIKWQTESERNIILSEAYWHRAYWYYLLVNEYGDVPFVGEEPTGAKLDYHTNSRWVILDKLEKDLEFAVQWLPEVTDPGVPSKYAGYHLLTKVYLANTEFDKAISAATKVIDGPFSLMKERFGAEANDPVRNVIWDLHRTVNFNASVNKETILATVDRFEAPMGAKSDGTYTMRMYNPAWMQARVRDSEGKPGNVSSGLEYDTLGRGNANVRLSPYYQYGLWNSDNYTWKNTTDLRRSDINWVDLHEIRYNNPASVDYGKPVNINYLANLADTLYVLYAIPQYIMYVPMQNKTVVPVGGNGDWYVFRLAETYLLRAEAYYWKNELALAASDINKVRERAHAQAITSEKVTIDFIFDERARELMAEEPRHAELARASYIMAKLNLNGYSLPNFSQKNYFYDRVMKYNVFYSQNIFYYGNDCFISPYNVAWPIPSSVILANTLGVINQNEGYNGADKNIPVDTSPIE